MKQIIILLFCLFSLFTNSVYAQPLLTLEEAVATVLKNNYDIQLRKNDSAVFALNNSYANAAFLPDFNAATTMLLNNNNTKQTLADGTQKNQSGIRSNNIQASVNMNWTIFDGFKMFATKKKLSAYVNLGNLEIKQELENTIAKTISTYYFIVSQKQQLRAIEDQMNINNELVLQAEKKLSVGLGAKPELLMAKTDLNAQQAARFAQLTKIDQLKDQLNQLMSVFPGTSFDVSDSIPINKEILIADIYSSAEKNNPALLIAKENIKIATLTLKEKKADRYPTLSAIAAYNFSRNKNQLVVNNFTPLLNRNYGFNYGLTAVIPIFNKFNVKRQIETAELDIKYQNIILQNETLKNNIAINSAYKTYNLALQTLSLEEENINLAKENVSIAFERNRLGLSTYLDLREAQKTLELAYNRLITARFNTKDAETELLRLTGELLTN